MSSKHSDSALPDELNDNWGSNYMLDGFWHDMDYGNGLQEDIGANPVPQPSTSGFSHLPDGVVMGNDCEPIFHDLPDSIEREDDGVDLANLEIVASYDPASDPSTTGIVDHEWLGEAYQDPGRLPDSPSDDGLDQLQQAWGDRTDGIRRIDMCDRIETKPNVGDQRVSPAITQQLIASTVRAAMRRSAAGISPRVLREEAERMLGDDGFRHVARALKAIEAEHGLVGNVYVRAAAYPGLHRGKWAKDLKRASKSARYLVASSDEDCAGVAQALNLRVISHPDEINWQSAFEHYAAQLVASGRLGRTAMITDKREGLRRAFLREGKSPRLDIETTKVVATMPVDGVSLEDARRAFDQAPKSERVHVTDDRPAQAEQAKLVRRLGSMVQARLITKEEAEKLVSAGGSARSRLKVAELLAVRTKRASYQGAVIGDPRVSISASEFESAKADQHRVAGKVAAAAEDGERRALLERFFRLQQVVAGAKKKVLKVAREVSEGLRGEPLRRRVSKLFDERERSLVGSILDPVLMRGGYYDDVQGGPREFAGPVLREAAPQRHEKLASPREIAGAVRWACLQMNDGFAGDDLDQLLQRRFSPSLLKAAEEQISAARSQHEALAGHLYVDARTYASAEGTKGCDEGALRHRTNGIKHVLAMPTCSACVFRNANNTCQKYNKTLVAGVDAPVAEDFRRKILAAHRASDHEATAALFAGSDPVSEFGLHNGSLDDVSSEEPVHEAIDDVFFGGLEV